MARVIGPEAFGLIGMLTIFMLLTESVVNNGFSQALVQRSGSLKEVDKSTIFYVNVLWGISIYILLFFAAPSISVFYQEPELVNIARLLFLVVIVNSLAVVVRAQLLIKLDFKSQAFAKLCATLLSSAVAIYLANVGYGYWSLVWMLIIKSIVLNVSLWLFCRWLPILQFSYESFKSLFRFGSNLMLAGLVSTLVNNLYVALIGRYFNATAVGYFTQSTTLTGFLSQFISSTLQGVTYPIMTSIKDDSKRLAAIYKQLISVTMLVALPALIGFAAIADSFVLLVLGESWIAIVPIIQVLCFARVVTPISSINMNVLTAIGRSDLFLKVDLFKIPIILTALLISVPHGIFSVALAMLCTSWISFFINAYYPHKFYRFGAFKQLKVARLYIFSSLVMFFVLGIVSFESHLITIVVSVFIGFFVYIAILLLFKDEMANRVIAETLNKIRKTARNRM